MLELCIMEKKKKRSVQKKSNEKKKTPLPLELKKIGMMLNKRSNLAFFE